ncbi:hypothetical protein Q7689_03950 [Nocardiopsis tropica]|jgi:hypothetical protein|uniref:hypothetical protein n=1 Tax=Nocardiopsis TaxID=2013 RepID=UPI002E8BEDEE|nr:hypothetical protein [Nocardiopsis tropica]
MRLPAPPLPPVDDAVRVHGMPLVRTDHGDDDARDVEDCTGPDTGASFHGTE